MPGPPGSEGNPADTKPGGGTGPWGYWAGNWTLRLPTTGARPQRRGPRLPTPVAAAGTDPWARRHCHLMAEAVNTVIQSRCSYSVSQKTKPEIWSLLGTLAKAPLQLFNWVHEAKHKDSTGPGSLVCKGHKGSPPPLPQERPQVTQGLQGEQTPPRLPGPCKDVKSHLKRGKGSHPYCPAEAPGFYLRQAGYRDRGQHHGQDSKSQGCSRRCRRVDGPLPFVP